MTKEQAIHCLKNYYDEEECEECNFYHNCTHETREDVARLAVSALEQQMPKKPIKQHETPTDEEVEELVDLGFYGGDVSRCPNCNEYIVIKDLKYCMECGQAIDWS